MKNPIDHLETIINLETPEQDLFAIWNTAPLGTSLLGIKQKEFYLDSELKLRSQLAIQEMFPGTILIPGPWPDFGVAVETSAFGCAIKWPDNEPPWVKPVITNMSEVYSLQRPKPGQDGITGLVVEQYQYMWDHLSPEYIERYGFLNGLGYILGPIETAALIVGYERFLMELYDHPREVHHLLKVVTDFQIEWLRVQERVNGKLKRLYMPEHFPAQVSPAHFEEFCYPYISEIFKAFPYAIGLYHNEGNVSHIMERIPDMGAKIFHFGNDLVETRNRIGGRICLMGNLDPISVMLNKTPEKVAEEARHCKEEMQGVKGFLLSTAGGMAPGTPRKNIEAVLKVLNERNILD